MRASVCAKVNLPMFCVNISAHIHIKNVTLSVCFQCVNIVGMPDVDTFLQPCVCFYLVEVSRVCIFTSDHVEEDGNRGPSQLLLRDQSHLQDGTHHARYETDLVTA